MTAHSTYETLRHFADSWGLAAMFVAFIALAAWPFRPGSSEAHRRAPAANIEDENDGEV